MNRASKQQATYIRSLIALLLLFAPSAFPGPLEFGKAELKAALASRGLPPTQVPAIQLTTDPPERFRIANGTIYAGGERGLMYGLLEAAGQIRATGRIRPAQGKPATPIRGIRVFVHSDEVEKERTREYWLAFIQMLARNRFNRLNLVFAHQTAYMAPPYPYWVNVESHPEVRARNQTPEQQRHNLDMLRYISETAQDHGIDFTLGIWEHNVQRGMTPSVDGLSRENIGPYSYEALKKVLRECPAIKSVQMRTNSESGIPADQQVEFYRDWVFRALKDAGRPVALDLRGWVMTPGLLDAAKNSRVPLRLSSKYWAEDLGRPYQPAETWPNYSYIDFLQKPRPYQFYWELWGLGSHRLLLWGDPDYVRRAVPTFTMSETQGFEIDPPLAQKGFGNPPGAWGVFTESQQDKIFWRYEFERYWMFYTLWGRLSYDPQTSDRVWMAEMERRFGATAAPYVMDAYQSASKILNEIVAVHLADPNMYIWPEINPGGLIDSYINVRPSDWRTVAAVPEAVRNRIRGIASGKQTPLQTAILLHEWVLKTEQAISRVKEALKGNTNKEWNSTESDLSVLAALGQYHGRKQFAADQLMYFYETGDNTALQAARRELVGADRTWKRIVQLTDGTYPPNMSFAPDDKGHWKDKVPYVEHDLAAVAERIRIFEQFGRADFAFDFGGAVQPVPALAYRADASVLQNTVEPRFRAVSPGTKYTDSTGYGWITDAPRAANALPLTPYLEVRAVAPNPKHLQTDVLFADSIRGTGAQVFRVNAPAGSYRVQMLHPDGSIAETTSESRDGHLDVEFAGPEWEVSGIVITSLSPKPSVPLAHWPETLPRPRIEHIPPSLVRPKRPLILRIKVAPESGVKSVRLHYRAVNQLAAFKTIEQPPNTSFTIPGNDVDARWDLLYYFEILNTQNSGWIYPDPHVATPYFVVRVAEP